MCECVLFFCIINFSRLFKQLHFDFKSVEASFRDLINTFWWVLLFKCTLLVSYSFYVRASFNCNTSKFSTDSVQQISLIILSETAFDRQVYYLTIACRSSKKQVPSCSYRLTPQFIFLLHSFLSSYFYKYLQRLAASFLEPSRGCPGSQE